ncbi:carboxypeptidase [Phyllobacterium brassicacearum]|uniref:Carboxypeptidase n=1 Tax=Phyllobacterium brassicacearum TaxID=314235 RepID=A0A2P7BPX2_9HYPH|nr:carboxypeptidase [Phyllobacterium brassicacearum]PSH68499.1 carboxypeptidase [Phyllobacterium brassicacearum]TDQ19827.1 chitinase class I [Phyllobacterium brassicacearum]
MNLVQPSTRLLVESCEREGLLRNQCAYVLATAWHETGAYKYMREIWGPTSAQKRYEGRKDLGNTVAGDGKKFMGRGFVQITGRRNYTDWSRRLGLDLLKEPQLAEQPEMAVHIIVKGMKLGTFTGKKLDDYVTLSKSDFVNARRIINGTDKAALIAGYAEQFDDLLKADGYGDEALVGPAPIAPPEASTPIPATPEPVKPQSLLASLLALFSRLFKKGS